jgi:hypothetical protein
MPKSRRGRQRGKRKGRKTFSAPAVQAPVAAETVKPTSMAGKPAPPAPKPKAPAVAVQTINVAAELRRIGIVAGGIVVILVILALILS